MKTKYILGALALPALLVGCVNDDFEQVQNSNVVADDLLKGRELINFTVEATKAGSKADTRIVGEITDAGDDKTQIDWYWEDRNDKLGAVVVDYGPDNSIVGLTSKPAYPNYAITNYPFVPQIDEPVPSAEFATNTAVVNGAYLFYNRYNGAAVQRGTIGHTIDRLNYFSYGREQGEQQVGTCENGGQNFFISPIMNFGVSDDESGNAELAKPIQLVSVYSVLNLRLTSYTPGYYDKGFKVNKVVVKTVAVDDVFKRNLVIDPVKLAELQKKVATNNPALSGYFLRNGALRTDIPKENIYSALKAVYAEIQDPANEIGDTTEPAGEVYTGDMVYQLNEPFVFKSTDDVMELYVIIPSDTYHYAKSAATLEGTKGGALRVDVYTSEGVYSTYLGKEDLKMLRGEKYNVKRELSIDGPNGTNIDIWDIAKGFDIETTEDYNYAIEYITNHYNQMGNANEWNAPELRFVDGAEINIDAAHYFPAFPIRYKGNATLVVDPKHEMSAYTLDPTTVILNKDNRPLIKIDNAEATVDFALRRENRDGSISFLPTDVTEKINNYKGNAGVDGTSITAAFRLESAATINIKEDQTVNFYELNSKTGLNVAVGADVIVGNANDAYTAGTVTIDATKEKPTSVVMKGGYTNSAEMVIEEYATLTLESSAASNTEEGKMTVYGLLNAHGNQATEFTNNGEINLKHWNIETENDDNRGTLDASKMVNNGTVNIEDDGANLKGTWGGLLKTETLANGGTINVNGELEGGVVTNTGVIALQNDPYARISVSAGSKSDEDGKVVLESPTTYEMYQGVHVKRNSLSDMGGTIEATLNNATYQQVMKNYSEYNTNQECAWQVINKVIVTDKLELQDNDENAEKDFVLYNNASIDIKENVTIASLTTAGTGTAITTSKAGTTFSVNEDVTVAANTDLTVVEGVKLMVLKENASIIDPMLDIAGTLTNNGSIDTKDGDTKANKIYTVVQANAQLINNGDLSKAAVMKFNEPAADKLSALVVGLYDETEGDYRGEWNEQTPTARVDIITNTTLDKLMAGKGTWNDKEQWESNLSYSDNRVTVDVIKKLMSEGKVVYVQHYQAIAVTRDNTSCWVLYLGGQGNGSPKYSDSEIAEWKKMAGDVRPSDVEGNFWNNYAVQGTWFYAHNYGQVTLSGNEWGDMWQMSENAGFTGALTEGVIYSYK